jgi:arsenite methyltransferase
MSIFVMLAHLAAERLARQEVARVPETMAVMEDPGQNDAYAQAGQGEGILAYVQLYHALQIAALVPPGGRVLDLGCGPATQVVACARLRPDASFTGVELSRDMLARARATVAGAGAARVTLVPGDMTSLAGIADGSYDCVTCTMTLHHLPDGDALERTVRAARRVLVPGGAAYLADFGRMKRAATQRYFARDRIEEQAPEFTRDFLLSMQAAFTLEELTRAAALLGPGVALHRTAFAPFLVVAKTPSRALDAGTRERFRDALKAMTALQQDDFQVLVNWMRLGGLALPLS